MLMSKSYGRPNWNTRKPHVAFSNVSFSRLSRAAALSHAALTSGRWLH